jgi:nucleoside-diphosphate-sugar epimerase
VRTADSGHVLILGASGRIGRAFGALHRAGLWPEGAAAPLWQQRSPDPTGAALTWDLLGDPVPRDPRLQDVAGIVALAGATTGDAAALAANGALGLAAARLGGAMGVPVLLCSSAAVYGRPSGPVSEEGPLRPATAYGEAKRTMEAAVAGMTHVTCLRIGNVAGADQLFAAMAAGPVRLDRFADGSGPRRAYVGPLSLLRIMLALLRRARTEGGLPPVLNIAAPGTVAMAEILEAAGAAWAWTPAPPAALPVLALDTGRLAALCPQDPDSGSAATLLAEARAAGWRPAP